MAYNDYSPITPYYSVFDDFQQQRCSLSLTDGCYADYESHRSDSSSLLCNDFSSGSFDNYTNAYEPYGCTAYSDVFPLSMTSGMAYSLCPDE